MSEPGINAYTALNSWALKVFEMMQCVDGDRTALQVLLCVSSKALGGILLVIQMVTELVLKFGLAGLCLYPLTHLDGMAVASRRCIHCSVQRRKMASETMPLGQLLASSALTLLLQH